MDTDNTPQPLDPKLLDPTTEWDCRVAGRWTDTGNPLPPAQGWLCPLCESAHGPHVDICPGSQLSIGGPELGWPVRLDLDGEPAVEGHCGAD